MSELRESYKLRRMKPRYGSEGAPEQREWEVVSGSLQGAVAHFERTVGCPLETCDDKYIADFVLEKSAMSRYRLGPPGPVIETTYVRELSIIGFG